MVTSKKTPARKVAKQAKSAATEVIAPAAKPIVVEVPVEAPMEKQKLIRDSFTMPKREYEQIALLKARLLKLKHAIKKGEVLRAGIAVLMAMSDAELLAAAKKVQRLKTGRPEKSEMAAGTSAKRNA